MADKQDEPRLISRRDAILRVSAMLGGTALVGQAAMLAGCAATPGTERRTAPSASIFRQSDVELLDEIAETILPETDTPGAKAAGVGPFVAMMVNDVYYPEDQQVFQAGLQDLQTRSLVNFGAHFQVVTTTQRTQLLEALDAEQHFYMETKATDAPAHYFRMIKELVLFGYFTSEVGYTQAMRYVETPARFDPCVPLAPGDKIWARHALMMNANRVIACVLAGLVATGCSAEVESESWIELFNGRDLDDWVVKIRGYESGDNFANTFRVEDGLLTVAYDGYDRFDDKFGHIFYREPYSHYRLLVEYRFIGEQLPDAPGWATRNSGVMLHSQDPASMPADQDFPISIEVQFLGGLGDGNSRPTANMCSPGTHIVYQGQLDETHCIESSSPTLDGDQWVTVEVLVLGDERIVHYVDGEQVMEYEKPTYGGGVVSGHRPEMKPDGQPLASGYISLQSESHPIQFRRVAILDLTACMASDDPEACLP